MMNLNECLIAEKDKQIAELAARVNRLKWAAEHFDNVEECEKILSETPTQSLQEHDKQVIENYKRSVPPFKSDIKIVSEAILEAASKMFKEMDHEAKYEAVVNEYPDCETWLIDYANNLTNGDDDENKNGYSVAA